MCIKIECIFEFDSLPSILKSKHRKVASQDGCLWMTDDTLIIKPANIISKVDIWLTDISEPSNFSHFITEIVYYINGWWITRSIDLRHHHPVEYITIQNPPSNLPTYRFFLDIYIDKFGPFRNAYHAIGGIYLQIGNMKQILRQKLKNHFLYGFIPYAAASDEVLQPIIKDIQELERGYELEINNQRVWVTGGLGVITSDLPEGNEQAGVKNHNAYYGCRNCMIHHNNLHDISFDIAKYGRYHHKTTLQFAEVRNTQTQTERDFLTMEYGIQENPSVFDNVMRDRHFQCPHDAFHCIGGIVKEMLQATFEILTAVGEEEFLKTWRNFEFPSTWSRQQNPITHLGSYFFSDYLRLSMIMPFLINRAITNVTLLNKPFTEHLIKVYNITKNQVIDRLLNLWVSFSKMVYLVFHKEFSENCYNNLQQSLMQWAIQVAKIFPNITRLPNFHIQCHFIMHAKNFATLVNTAVPTKEMMHRLYKGIVPHSNKKDIELDFVHRDNCLQTLRFLLDGGTDERYNSIKQFDFNMLSKDYCIHLLLNLWYISPQMIDLEYEKDTNISQITCMDESYINMRVQGRYKKNDLRAAGLEGILNDNLFSELECAYQEELNCIKHIASRKVKYFKSISYSIIENNNQIDVNLRVGDIINVLEDISTDTINDGENEATTIVSYARIQAIFLHTKDQLEIPFLILDWFISLNTNDSKLDCSRYRLQRSADHTWRQIYVVKWVDHQPNVHFVHQCRKSVIKTPDLTKPAKAIILEKIPAYFEFDDLVLQKVCKTVGLVVRTKYELSYKAEKGTGAGTILEEEEDFEEFIREYHRLTISDKTLLITATVKQKEKAKRKKKSLEISDGNESVSEDDELELTAK
ncbi:hypothetical protein GLOIN_2v1480079 [Rhizophagus irregularis DAOM 181602=DAOM 197198]|uniref:Transposase domain-containing protein n=1 Tax=Rhizophagus irregularis (strain DAOM 181602 / DAOM 197198 / MUCL 43194) TaxID=747089 RepID=A0A2P4PVA3_RHIID|nr:hypothetical protein GLOIN_2v1480079 [Rhizophagus irregularis DAOM 181602=DAOM 197198]POG69329.1 hypothetical protein GLOIN_2v1480079 [Rhizophagus irregularis DAOM 181602=DAOM 197198]|eukprot:XP_025176195.1 hypothetical protein GLOIN_2v1480079 [Rhizophagus irregularis DAOM 181602=DAOM 197198]